MKKIQAAVAAFDSGRRDSKARIFFFFKTAVAIRDLLCFHRNFFENFCSSSVKMPLVI